MKEDKIDLVQFTRDFFGIEPMTKPAPNFAKPSPRDLREWKPKLRFLYRCAVCGEVFQGSASDDHHCGEWAKEIEDETEDAE